MKISKTQQRLSDYLKNTEVLTNPEPYLGPNYQAVLRFWLYYESLTSEQENELDFRYGAIDYDTRIRARVLARNAAIEVIGWDNRDAVWIVAPCQITDDHPYLPITYELIALHELENPFFLPLLVPEFDHKQN
jgi:hypothetical protein